MVKRHEIKDEQLWPELRAELAARADPETFAAAEAYWANRKYLPKRLQQRLSIDMLREIFERMVKPSLSANLQCRVAEACQCLSCSHKWIGIIHRSSNGEDLECPNCGEHLGETIEPREGE